MPTFMDSPIFSYKVTCVFNCLEVTGREIAWNISENSAGIKLEVWKTHSFSKQEKH